MLGVKINEMILVLLLRSIKAKMRPLNTYTHSLKIKDVEFQNSHLFKSFYDEVVVWTWSKTVGVQIILSK